MYVEQHTAFHQIKVTPTTITDRFAPNIQLANKSIYTVLIFIYNALI